MQRNSLAKDDVQAYYSKESKNYVVKPKTGIADIIRERDRNSRPNIKPIARPSYREDSKRNVNYAVSTPYFNLQSHPSHIAIGNTEDAGSMFDIESVSAMTDLASQGALPASLSSIRITPYKELPTLDQRMKILEAIEAYRVIVIDGSTGCGKSTQIPQYILDHHNSKGKRVNIIVTQPRKIAAISIATWICEERDIELGKLVGYKVSTDVKVDENTQLTYVTTGVLLRYIIKAVTLNPFTHIVLDEVHERDQDTDFVLLLVKKLLQTPQCANIKIILMSASIQAKKFAQYFASLSGDKLYDAPIIEIPLSTFQVELNYLNEPILKKIMDDCNVHMPMFDLDYPELNPELIDVCARLIESFDNYEVVHFGQGAMQYAVLVFLPGQAEMLRVKSKLLEYSSAHQKKWRILMCHSELPLSEQKLVFKKFPHQRKIVLTTNIAESSITVPDVVSVVDFCLTKVLVTDKDTGYRSLNLSWACKANCKQRRGRAGRVMNGMCYRLVPEYFFRSLEVYPECEMRNSPLDKLILYTKTLSDDDPKLLLSSALDPPYLNDFERAVLKLKQAGALTMRKGGRLNLMDGDITFIGKLLTDLPCSVSLGKLIIFGYLFNCLEECTIIAACMSERTPFISAFEKSMKHDANYLLWSKGYCSDPLTLLFVFKEYKTQDSQCSKSVLNSWCKSHSLQLRKLENIEDILQKFNKVLIDHHLRLPGEPAVSRVINDNVIFYIRMAVCAAFYPNYFSGKPPMQRIDAERELNGLPLTNTVKLSGHSFKNINEALMYMTQLKNITKESLQHTSEAFFTIAASHAYITYPSDINAFVNDTPLAVYLALRGDDSRNRKEINLSRTDTHVDENCLYKNYTERTAAIRLKGSLHVFESVAIPQDKHEIMIDIQVFHSAIRFSAHIGLDSDEMLNNIIAIDVQDAQPVNYDEVKRGDLFLAPYLAENDTKYYRAKLIEVVVGATPSEHMAKINYVDYGNEATVKFSTLLKPSSRLLEIPIQARTFQLINLAEVDDEAQRKANVKCVVNECFERSDEDYFYKFKIYSEVNGVVRGTLFFVHNIKETINFNEVLLRRGLAEHCEESYLSNSNNMFRMTNSTIKPRPQQEVTNRLMQGICRLRGPTHPSLVRFFGMSLIGKDRRTTIQRLSVNSVVLDPHQSDEDPTEIFMVADDVMIRKESSNISCHATTVFPKKRGWIQFIALLFSPIVELRIDSKKKFYTGALCGMGFDDSSKNSLNSDDDMEIAFDVELTEDDIIWINRFKMYTNLILAADRRPGDEAIQSLREKILQCITRIFNSHHKPITPIYFPRRYRWNQIESRCLSTWVTDSFTREGFNIPRNLIYELIRIVDFSLV